MFHGIAPGEPWLRMKCQVLITVTSISLSDDCFIFFHFHLCKAMKSGVENVNPGSG